RALTAALGLLLGSGTLLLLAPPALGTYLRLLTQVTRDDTGTFAMLTHLVLPTLAFYHGVFVVLTVLGSCAIGLAQTRFQVSPKALRPRFDRLNPAQGLKQLFSLDKLADLAITLLQVAMCAVLLFQVIAHALAELPGALALAEPGTHLAHGGRQHLLQLAQAGAALLPLALADLWLKHRLRLRQLRMSQEEVRRETREDEGQPEIRQWARRSHEEGHS
ncbi:MAG TPA: EscU/YscU/HrcU family type III secretion system export apparatus switch protein, partial [Stenotrophomonas sp.]|nr:EscU/YscU/HrcU family type III secretion system export apparatus switch protein [Stenotrophomonas sp.]